MAPRPMSSSPPTERPVRSSSTTARRGARCRPTRSLARKESVRKAAISLPGIEEALFHLARYDLLLQPEKGQLGVIGADLLSRLTVELTPSAVFLGAEPCRPQALIARGLTPIAQTGFFSSDPAKIDPRRPDVPVVFLRLGDVRAFAQIDTGYEDLAYARSVDINQALFERLVQSGIKLDRAGDVDVWTCDGRERRPRYEVKDRALESRTSKECRSCRPTISI